MFGSDLGGLRRHVPTFLVLAWLLNGLFFSTGPCFPLLTEARAGSPAPAETEVSHRGHAIAISAHRLQTLMQMDPHLVLVDVRGADEANGPAVRIKGALPLPLKAVEKDPLQFPAGKTVVFISRTGPRSLKAARAVAAHGGVAYWVEGGLKAWHQISNPKFKQQAPVKEKGPAPAVSEPPEDDSEPWQEEPGGIEPEEEDMGC